MKNLTIFLVFCLIIATVMSSELECHHGETKQIECNTCRCNNGRWTCPRKFCPTLKKREAVCKPGSTFKKDCNTCVCNAEGTNAACTLKACL